MRRNKSSDFPRICFILSWFILLGCFWGDAFARQESSPVVDLGRIIVTSANRSGIEKNRTADHVSVYTTDDLDHIPGRDLGEILRYIPGVNVSVTGQFGQPSAVSIRGSSSRQVLVMVDGIPLNTQLTGQANPTRIPKQFIERIEVIKGGASSAWGSSLGGVINVITKQAGAEKPLKGTMTNTFAEYETTQNSLELRGTVENWDYLLWGERMTSDGIKSLSRASEKKTFVKIAQRMSDEWKMTESFGYSGSYTRDGVNKNGFWYERPTIWRYGQWKVEHEGIRSHVSASYKISDQDIITDTFYAPTKTHYTPTISSNLYQGISLVGDLDLAEDTQVVAGTDWEWHRIKSNNYLSMAETIDMQAPYVHLNQRIDDFDLLFGLRYDRNDQFGEQVSPSAGVVYHFNESGSNLLRAKVSRVFNAPPLMWLYQYDPSFLVGPNPDLRAERAMVYEIGTELDWKEKIRMEVDFYRSDIKDAIATRAVNGLYIQDNYQKFCRQGFESTITYDMTDQFSFYVGGAFNDAKNKETKQRVRDSGVARHSLYLGFDYQVTEDFSVTLTGVYNRWTSAPTLKPNDRKFIFDLKMVKKMKFKRHKTQMDLFFNIYNLTDAHYWASENYPLPRRYFEGGFSLDF